MVELQFVWSDLVAEEAAAAFDEHERRIRERLPTVEIRHTGGTSVPGVLTSGDVDLQVRTDRRFFRSACDVLCELYEPLYPEAWHSDSAYFVAADATPRVEVALTVIGTLDDLHHGGAWDCIAASPGLIEEYNALKRAHDGGSAEEYNVAKRDIFYGNFRSTRVQRTCGRSRRTCSSSGLYAYLSDALSAKARGDPVPTLA